MRHIVLSVYRIVSYQPHFVCNTSLYFFNKRIYFCPTHDTLTAPQNTTGGLFIQGSFKSRPGSSSRPTPRYAHDSRQREHTLLKRLGGGQHDDAAGVSFSAPPFPPPAPPRDSRRRFDAAESRGSGVRADYSGARDAGQLVRRVEASARAVSLEKDDIIEVCVMLF